jgi:hypothetical protein
MKDRFLVGFTAGVIGAMSTDCLYNNCKLFYNIPGDKMSGNFKKSENITSIEISNNPTKEVDVRLIEKRLNDIQERLYLQKANLNSYKCKMNSQDINSSLK